MKTQVTASKAATRLVHGQDLAVVQAQASGDFGVVGKEWLAWWQKAVEGNGRLAYINIFDSK